MFLLAAAPVVAGCTGTPSPLAPSIHGSIGYPHAGMITDAVPIPLKGEGYTLLRKNGVNWGNPRLVEAIRDVARSVAHERPGAPLIVGDLAGRWGGESSGHRSHRTGRDADLLIYVVTPDGGNAENGVVNVSVSIVTLTLEAPGPHVIIDGPSFVLAGRTMKGAEVLAAGRSIVVRPDGTFAQVMNVSSVGATQIEVRARIPGLAPRLAQIKVRRVESLEAAAKELMAGETIGYGALAGNIAGNVGKAVAVTGEVTDIKKQGYETVMLLDVPQAQGCTTAGACTVRLVLGAESLAKKGDTLRIYGHVARAVALPGRADVPEIEVDFALGASGKAPSSAPGGGK